MINVASPFPQEAVWSSTKENIINKIVLIKKTSLCCNMFGKEGLVKEIRDHIEAKHLEGISFPCDYCDKTFTSRNNLA